MRFGGTVHISDAMRVALASVFPPQPQQLEFGGVAQTAESQGRIRASVRVNTRARGREPRARV
jgi:hypothetical protein